MIKISTVKRRIENILSAYNEQMKNSTTQETLPSSSSCSTNTSSSSSISSSSDKIDEKKKMPFSYETLDIDAILRMTEKESEPKTNSTESRPKRQSGALKRTSTPQSDGPEKKTQTDSDSSSTPSKKPKVRSSARQRSQRNALSKNSWVVTDIVPDHDENNAKAAKNN